MSDDKEELEEGLTSPCRLQADARNVDNKCSWLVAFFNANVPLYLLVMIFVAAIVLGVTTIQLASSQADLVGFVQPLLDENQKLRDACFSFCTAQEWTFNVSTFEYLDKNLQVGN